MRIEGFDYQRVEGAGAELLVASAGTGSPIVLLHGFPQHHLAWRHVAPRLTDNHRVICIDLRGYGASEKPATGPEGYSKRSMAADVIAVLDRLGEPTATVVGHDRGGLVAFRTALDHPTRVARLGIIGALPTLDLWDTVTGPVGVRGAHLFFLAQPSDFPERLIRTDPDRFFGHYLTMWRDRPATLPDEVREAYLEPLRAPDAIRAVCDDHRAGAFVDPDHDTTDRATGTVLTMPVLAIWEDTGTIPLPFDPAQLWARWAPRLTVRLLPGGHFLPEDCPVDVSTAITDLAS
jgi:pimeloyl-ACP methyl ester carboxylesterase